MKINQRLFDHYGIDTQKDLGIKSYCPRPYDTILIDKNGSCYACECQSWLPQSIGNLQIKSLDEILNGPMRQQVQGSILDNSYRYCNNKQCSWLQGQDFRYFRTSEPIDRIKHIRLAIDNSCNLRCPSCRKEMIFHKEGSVFNLGIRLADRINDWLHRYEHPTQVHIGSDGDPFASHVYRHFMMNTPVRDNIKYSILTNALMLKEFHSRVPNVIRNLKELGVSIDGASKETYERLRLGGKWEKINENLEYISELKDKHGFRFIIHYVVQKDNYHEMEDIILLGKKYNADRVWLNKIEDWNVSPKFKERDIFRASHPLHGDYRRRLKKIETYLGFDKNPIVEIPTLNIKR
jgi:wyosine [tRNA(Phe)-imidazoG37] synthetase (radical SAM superfamily)